MKKNNLKQYEFNDAEKKSLAFERGFRFGLSKCLKIINNVKEDSINPNEKMILKLVQIKVNALTKYNEKKQIL